MKRKPKPLVLYSTNTWLAYAISERFYRGIHYVWCTPHAGPSSVPSHDATDRHSALIQQNRAGILRGAQSRRQQGVIGEPHEGEIRAVVSLAETRDFKPCSS